jgi:hypothetical protein
MKKNFGGSQNSQRVVEQAEKNKKIDFKSQVVWSIMVSKGLIPS